MIKTRKKSQVTLFIILGTVILVIFALVFYLISYVSEIKGQEDIDETQKIPAELKPINDYIESCLSRVAQDGLELLGLQGGRIPSSEGGLTSDLNVEGKDFINYLRKNKYEMSKM